jgi:mRNA interferase RelE/StbE
MSYDLFETEGFLQDIEQDFEGRKSKILRKLRTYFYPQLTQEPHAGPNIKKLKDFSPDTWRYRIGDYRFFYEIDESEQTVFLTAARDRKASY